MALVQATSIKPRTRSLRDAGRILYVSSVDVSQGDGPGVNEREFIRALYGAVGQRAVFVIPRPAEVVPHLPVEACLFCRPHQNHRPLRYLLHCFSQLSVTHKVLAKMQFDLIVFRLDILPAVALFLSRSYSIPYAIKTLGQGELNVLAERGGWVGRVLTRLNTWMFRKLVESAIATDVCSRAMVQYMSEYLRLQPRSFTYIDNSVDVSRFAPLPTSVARRLLALEWFNPVVGYVGSHPLERGGLHLIEVLPELLAEFPHIGALVVGDDGQVPRLRERAEALGVVDHCVFAGYVCFDRIPLYVNALDVGVSVSFRPDRYRASELKVRQYLACGKPVVASPGGNEFITERDFGSIVHAQDFVELKRHLVRWLSLGQAERAQFARRVRQYAVEQLSDGVAMAKRLEVWSARYASAEDAS